MTIKEFIAKYNIEVKQTRVHSRPDEINDWASDSRHWEVVLEYLDEYTRKYMPIYFTQGSAWKTKPTANDVLSSLLLDVQTIEGQNFSEWAYNLGYSDDSIKALKIYDACLKENKEIKNWLGVDKYNEFLQCEE